MKRAKQRREGPWPWRWRTDKANPAGRAIDLLTAAGYSVDRSARGVAVQLCDAKGRCVTMRGRLIINARRMTTTAP